MRSEGWQELIREAAVVDNIGTVRAFTLDEVEQWAAINGGELAVRNALATEKISHPTCVQVAEAWLTACERQRAQEHASASLETSRRSAMASERAARWAMWSAVISAATAIASALWTVLGPAITSWAAARH